MSRSYKGKRKQRRGPALTTIFLGLGALAVVVGIVIAGVAIRANWDTISQKMKVEKKEKVKKEKKVTQQVEEQEEQQEVIEEKPSYITITSEGEEEMYNSCFRIGDTAYEMYTYSEKNAKAYANVVNGVANKLVSKTNVYVMPIPLSSGVTIPDKHLNSDTFGNQGVAIQDINGLMNENIHTVDVYDALMQHRGEYIYFRTDHHWTGTGAYYAYAQWCEVKGVTANNLTSYRPENFDGYLGSFYYTGTNKNALMGENPDTVIAYHPLSTEATMKVTTQNGSEFGCGVIYDESQADASLKYGCFIAGDNPISIISNPSKTDGSTLIVVKESFGNALVPFLVDHYQTIYVIDYRYWEGSLVELAKTTKATDMIFANNLSALRDSTRMGEMTKIM